MVEPLQQIPSIFLLFLPSILLSISDLDWGLLMVLEILLWLVSLTEEVLEVLEVLEVEILVIHLQHDSRLNNTVSTSRTSTRPLPGY